MSCGNCLYDHRDSEASTTSSSKTHGIDGAWMPRAPFSLTTVIVYSSQNQARLLVQRTCSSGRRSPLDERETCMDSTGSNRGLSGRHLSHCSSARVRVTPGRPLPNMYHHVCFERAPRCAWLMRGVVVPLGPGAVCSGCCACTHTLQMRHTCRKGARAACSARSV
jgi:hypothetical protein